MSAMNAFFATIEYEKKRGMKPLFYFRGVNVS
jgi:hypothetical protein